MRSNTKRYSMNFLFIILSCLMLSSCTTPRAVFVRSDGEYITCASTGIGIISSILAERRFASCVADAKAQGYRMENQ